MLDGEELTIEEYHKMFTDELNRLRSEKQKANSEENNDTTKHSKQGAFSFLYAVDIIKTQHYGGFDFDLNGVLDGN